MESWEVAKCGDVLCCLHLGAFCILLFEYGGVIYYFRPEVFTYTARYRVLNIVFFIGHREVILPILIKITASQIIGRS